MTDLAKLPPLLGPDLRTGSETPHADQSDATLTVQADKQTVLGPNGSQLAGVPLAARPLREPGNFGSSKLTPLGGVISAFFKRKLFWQSPHSHQRVLHSLIS